MAGGNVTKTLRKIALEGQSQTPHPPSTWQLDHPALPLGLPATDVEGRWRLPRALGQVSEGHEPHPLVSKALTLAHFEHQLGANRRAIRCLLAPHQPLVDLNPRPAFNAPRLVKLNAAGIQALVQLSHSQERADILEKCAAPYRKSFLLAWLKLSNEAHDYWSNDQQELSAHASLDELNIADSSGTNTLPTASSEESPEPVPAGPSTDAAYKRELTHELVISWKYAENAEAKDGIARALLNTGATQLGEANQETEFVGRYHQCAQPLFPGDRVRILQPGWMIHDGVGEYLLEKAIVEPA